MVTDMDKTEVVKHGEILERYATHFVERPWDWSRRGPERVIYPRKGLWDPARFPGNLRYALAGIVRDRRRKGGKSQLDELFGRIGWWPMFRARLRTHYSHPDGQLEGGGVIVYWEETGEYVQMVQPPVGELIGQWLQAEPENEWAQKVAGKLEEIAARYSESLDVE